VKYLPQYGWQPVVFGPEDPHYPVTDESTFADIPAGTEVLHTHAWEPFALFNIVQGKKPDEKVQDVFLVREKKPGLIYNAGVWVRGNFFIPDARMFWIRPSVKYLLDYLKKNPVDAILSSGPPHSAHRIAYAIKKATGVRWIADFQDPWTQIDYFEKFMLTPWARKRHQRQEREVLQLADVVTTVSPSWAADFETLSGRKVLSLTMGYDAEDFNARPIDNPNFSISHFGTLGIDRNPKKLWAALNELCEEIEGFRADLKIELAGVIDYSVFEDIRQNSLETQMQYDRFLNRSAVIARMQATSVLLLLLNKGFGNYNVRGRIPAKLFEYLGAAQPVLALGLPGSDVDHIISASSAGLTLSYEDKEKLKNTILQFYRAWQSGSKLFEPHNTDQYTFNHIAGEMSKLLG
jgi:hypothetical protein